MPSRLSELLFLHRSTMTGILQRLEARGLVTRREDPDDGRRARFELTPRGREVDGATAGTVEAAVRRALSKVPEADLRVATEVVATVVAELSRDDR
jgi:DNA-binding MarR family transcriptional regulator